MVFELIRRIAGWVGALIGAVWVGLLERMANEPSAMIFAISICATSALILIIAWEIISYFRNKPKVFKRKDKILKYMKKWVSKDGRVAMVTRDLSWADDDMIKILEEKSNKNDLDFFCHPKNPYISNFESKGAKIYRLPDGFLSRVSFTIRSFEKVNEELAIAIPGNPHTIKEFGANSIEIALAKSFLSLAGHEKSKNE